MNRKEYGNVIKILDEIAVKTQDSKTDDIASWVRTSLEEEHKPTMALVSFNLNHTDRLNILKHFFCIELPKEITEMIDGEPTCLILDYHDTPALLGDQRTTGTRIVFGVPFEALRNFRIVICDEIRSKAEWLALSNEIDTACLVVNATMAMNEMERTWIKECATPFFAENEFALLITKMEQLNEEEDIQDVRKIVADSLKRLNVSIRVFETIEDSLEWMSGSLHSCAVQENHDRRVVKNGLNAMSVHLKYLMNNIVIDAAAIQSAIDQLKRQQKTLELAGLLAAESILTNALNKLKIQLCDGIRDYGSQMAANIQKKVKNTPLEQLAAMSEKINGYVSGSWDYYIKSMSAKTDAEIEAIAQKLTKQMEMDAGKLISELDESARKTVYSALGLSWASKGTTNTTFIDPSMIQHRNALTEINIETITNQLRRETRNMMLLSIPLFFVNPLVSLGNIFVAKIYGKFKTNSELNDIRSEIAVQIEKACFDNAESFAHQVELCFDDEIRTGSLNIKSAYNHLVQQIENSLIELRNSQEERIALKEYLSNQVNVVFSGFMPDI